MPLLVLTSDPSLPLPCPPTQLLEAALGHWDFLRKVFEAGHGGRVLRALGSMAEDERSEYSEDAMRWLRRYMNDFEQVVGGWEGGGGRGLGWEVAGCGDTGRCNGQVMGSKANRGWEGRKV